MADLQDFSGFLDEVSPGWRQDYQNWRKGGAAGAKGELTRLNTILESEEDEDDESSAEELDVATTDEKEKLARSMTERRDSREKIPEHSSAGLLFGGLRVGGETTPTYFGGQLLLSPAEEGELRLSPRSTRAELASFSRGGNEADGREVGSVDSYLRASSRGNAGGAAAKNSAGATTIGRGTPASRGDAKSLSAEIRASRASPDHGEISSSKGRSSSTSSSVVVVRRRGRGSALLTGGGAADAGHFGDADRLVGGARASVSSSASVGVGLDPTLRASILSRPSRTSVGGNPRGQKGNSGGAPSTRKDVRGASARKSCWSNWCW